jgi:hypothetical protein
MRAFSNTHWGNGGESAHNSFGASRASLFKFFHHCIPRRIEPIPPAPALCDQLLFEVHAIRGEHISRGALELIETCRFGV